MSASAFPALVECLSDLPDPRIARTRLHSLLDVLVIALCAVLCGAEGGDDMHAFGVAKRAWLQERRDLPHGIASANTFRRVFARLEPSALQACFRLWTQTLHPLTEGEVIARGEHGAENMAVLRHIALNLLREEKTSERGIKARQKRAGWDSAYLEQVRVS